MIRNASLIPGWRRSARAGQSNPLQYSCQENSMDRGAWQAVVYGVTKSWTRLKQLNTHAHKVTAFEMIGYSFLSEYVHSEMHMMHKSQRGGWITRTGCLLPAKYCTSTSLRGDSLGHHSVYVLFLILMEF